MADKTDSAGAMQVDLKLVRQLAEMLDATNLTEIEVEDGDRKVRVARTQSMQATSYAPAMVAAPVATAPAPAVAEAAPAVPDLAGAIKSPMVGTCYLTPEPDAPAFVKVGDAVKAGQTLLIVEAMKHMNPIVAPRDGRVTAIFVEDAHPVEFGEPLLILE